MGKLLFWWTRCCRDYNDLVKVAVVATLANLAYGIMNLSAVPPFVISRHWTHYIGVIYATFLITETMFKAPMGYLGDRIGRRQIYLMNGVVGAASCVVWTIVPWLWLILVVRIVDGAVSAGLWSATVVAIGGAVGEKERTMAMTVFTLTFVGALAFSPLLGGLANDATHSVLTSFYVAALLFVVIAFSARALIPVHLVDESASSSLPGRDLGFFSELGLGLRRIPQYLLMAFMTYLPIGLILPIVKLFALQQLHMSETEYGLIVLVGALSVVVPAIFTGKLANFWGKATSVKVGAGISAVAMFTVPLMHSPWHMLFFASFVGLGFVIGLPAWLALVTDLARPEMRGAIMGAVGTSQGLGEVAANFISAYLYTSVPIHVFGLSLNSHYTPFMAAAVGMTASFVVALVFVKEHPQRVSP